MKEDIKIEFTYLYMIWDRAIDYATSKGMFIPNKRQCEELKLFGCWTSTTREDCTTMAYIGCIGKESKFDKHPVIMISESNTTDGVISYRINDEGW